MNIQSIEFSSFAIYYFLILAVIIFLIFRMLNNLCKLLPVTPERRQKIRNIMPLIELGGWIAFFIWGIQFFAANNHLYSMGLFVILMIIAIWFVWKIFQNFIAGIVFRLSKKFRENEIVRIGDYKGKIEHFGMQEMILETESGEHIYLPYAHLHSQIIIKSNPAEMIRTFSFRLSTPDENGITETTDIIKRELISLPWISLTRKPQLIFREKLNGKLCYEVTLYTYEAESHLKIIEELEKKYSITLPDSPKPKKKKS